MYIRIWGLFQFANIKCLFGKMSNYIFRKGDNMRECEFNVNGELILHSHSKYHKNHNNLFRCYRIATFLNSNYAQNVSLSRPFAMLSKCHYIVFHKLFRPSSSIRLPLIQQDASIQPRHLFNAHHPFALHKRHSSHRYFVQILPINGKLMTLRVPQMYQLKFNIPLFSNETNVTVPKGLDRLINVRAVTNALL